MNYLPTVQNDFTRLINCSTSIKLTDTTFTKRYLGIDDYHWNRIKKASQAFSDVGIGPLVLCIKDTDDNRSITYERVIPFDYDDGNVRPPGLSFDQIKEQIRNSVTTMHDIGYGHGDLNPNNMGFLGDKIYIIDHDTVYRIAEGPVPWLLMWMERGFDWEDTFEAFIENDYSSWETEWLDEPGPVDMME